MFGARYFGARFFAPRYFGKRGAIAPVVDVPVPDMHDGRYVEHVERDDPPAPVLEDIRTTLERARRRVEGTDNLTPAQSVAAEKVIRRVTRTVDQALPDPHLVASLLATLDAIGSNVRRAEQDRAIDRLRRIAREIEDEEAAIALLFAA